MKIKVYPSTDYLISFLQARGFSIVKDENEKVDVLHYCGIDEKELVKLIKQDKPDLVIVHRIEPRKILKLEVLWVWHHVKNQKDLYKTKRLLTNNFKICQLYYQKMGVQAEIQVLDKPKKKESVLKYAESFNKLKTYFQKLKRVMLWK